jgi:hypothetical protein
LNREGEKLIKRNGPPRDAIRECLAFDVLHHDEGQCSDPRRRRGMTQMCGWFSAALACASRSNRCRPFGLVGDVRAEGFLRQRFDSDAGLSPCRRLPSHPLRHEPGFDSDRVWPLIECHDVAGIIGANKSQIRILGNSRNRLLISRELRVCPQIYRR